VIFHIFAWLASAAWSSIAVTTIVWVCSNTCFWQREAKIMRVGDQENIELCMGQYGVTKVAGCRSACPITTSVLGLGLKGSSPDRLELPSITSFAKTDHQTKINGCSCYNSLKTVVIADELLWWLDASGHLFHLQSTIVPEKWCQPVMPAIRLHIGNVPIAIALPWPYAACQHLRDPSAALNATLKFRNREPKANEADEWLSCLTHRARGGGFVQFAYC